MVVVEVVVVEVVVVTVPWFLFFEDEKKKDH